MPLLSVLSHRLGLTLAQGPVSEATNEIGTIPQWEHPQVMAALPNAAIGRMRQAGHRTIAAAWDAPH